MISNKKIIKLVDIIYWLVIVITVIIQWVNTVNMGEINLNEIKSATFMQYMQFFIGILFIIIFQFVTAILKNFFITIIYFGIKVGYKKYSKEKLEKIDFKNDKYFRDIIPELSPAVLSYIDDFQLDEKDIVATLLGLQLKQKIDINKKIEIKDSSEENLTENEKYVFQNLKNGTLKNISMSIFEQKVVSDCKQKCLLIEKQNIKQEIIKKIILGVIIYALIFIAFYKLPNIYNQFAGNNDNFIVLFLIVMSILFCTMVIYPYRTIIYIRTYYFMNKVNPYVRNKNAKEINDKLEGLKKYIKEYSLMNERKKEEINIWEDYLIYSVIFGENTQIVKEIIKIIKDIEDKA